MFENGTWKKKRPTYFKEEVLSRVCLLPKLLVCVQVNENVASL